ncbi:MAG: hypothetical protein ACI4U5_06120, partial [Bacilli bacterium]
FISPDSIDYLEPTSINGLNLYCYCGNDPINRWDPSGHSVILIGMLVGFGVGALIGGGFEIGKQIYDNGWNFKDWDLKQIGLSALGGAIAGAISAIPIPGSGLLSYLGSFAIGGTASVMGGLISGSVDNWQTAAIAFGIGGFANMVARGVTNLINKGITANAQKQLSNSIYADVKLSDLVGIDVKNNGINISYLSILKHASQLTAYSFGNWVKSAIYAFLNSTISCLISGWY